MLTLSAVTALHVSMGARRGRGGRRSSQGCGQRYGGQSPLARELLFSVSLWFSVARLCAGTDEPGRLVSLCGFFSRALPKDFFQALSFYSHESEMIHKMHTDL